MSTKAFSMSKLRADVTYSHHLHNNSLITELAIDNNNYVNQDPGILNGINNPADNLVPIEENNSEGSDDEADEPQLGNELANIFNTIICKYDAKFIYRDDVLAWSDDEVTNDMSELPFMKQHQIMAINYTDPQQHYRTIMIMQFFSTQSRCICGWSSSMMNISSTLEYLFLANLFFLVTGLPDRTLGLLENRTELNILSWYEAYLYASAIFTLIWMIPLLSTFKNTINSSIGTTRSAALRHEGQVVEWCIRKGLQSPDTSQNYRPLDLESKDETRAYIYQNQIHLSPNSNKKNKSKGLIDTSIPSPPLMNSAVTTLLSSSNSEFLAFANACFSPNTIALALSPETVMRLRHHPIVMIRLNYDGDENDDDEFPVPPAHRRASMTSCKLDKFLGSVTKTDALRERRISMSINVKQSGDRIINPSAISPLSQLQQQRGSRLAIFRNLNGG
ncbi:hypothetical protein RCL_jg5020.t1 [Rhizophagus clarus]|uniref:Uncharacterized protein n=2 Tax=Rhizophagus clarus TaxID=94130 RepID=A0A8H3QIP2_9GLOM|nr:hypothetical protein RCL_jg5020.t1 [Rhizophagus clarus]